ncbi:Heme A synthase, cytochrome oxidase biogenesis protein Cox15-CtaA [Fulvivirga imtechensis AK7]|uniref:Heme A synthase, cytochrome oxidase biogenesis protein Cox15-CtaA n=1 Tax=Fulvivirga imtechensis AK7 TaxID=1237149 RepID=L8JXC1_9BACT|nr:COX15/CtaA family protein [Fulvivirga imtechensis]ELR73440.1 Heme A synthase, cytochrome oxidase biogenesis protein Cox15-CtaA [Fulvivirga imtechensis AK7]
MNKNRSAIIAWLWSGIFLVLLMVMVGGITRLTGSGLSIVEWKVISGTIPPLNEQDWQKAFEAYQQFPEYQKLNYHLTLSGFKSIFWWEYIHRLIGRIIGIVFIIPFIYFLITKSLTNRAVRSLLFILSLGMVQGVMGWVMVESGLQDNPHVSHYRLAMHLGLALLLIGAILWLILDMKNNERVHTSTIKSKSRALPIVCLVVIFIQIILGAFVAGLKAGFYYNTFPLMDSTLLPVHTFDHGDHLFDNGAFVQFLHRWFAWIVTGTIVMLWRRIRSGYYPKKIRRYADYLLIVVCLQVITGIATLVLSVPLVLGVIHQVLAVLIFGMATVMLYYLRHSVTLSFTPIVKPSS